jgi:hypothetical protein
MKINIRCGAIATSQRPPYRAFSTTRPGFAGNAPEGAEAIAANYNPSAIAGDSFLKHTKTVGILPRNTAPKLCQTASAMERTLSDRLQLHPVQHGGSIENNNPNSRARKPRRCGIFCIGAVLRTRFRNADALEFFPYPFVLSHCRPADNTYSVVIDEMRDTALRRASQGKRPPRYSLMSRMPKHTAAKEKKMAFRKHVPAGLP